MTRDLWDTLYTTKLISQLCSRCLLSGYKQGAPKPSSQNELLDLYRKAASYHEISPTTVLMTATLKTVSLPTHLIISLIS
jgi:hypothetical protein